MLARLVQSIGSFLGVLACYGLYYVLAVPVLEYAPAGHDDALVPSGQVADAPSPHTVALKTVFEEGSWERGEVNVIRARHLYLLWKSHEAIDASHLHVKPLTIAFLGSHDTPNGTTPEKADDRSIVWILRAPAGATLQFDGGLDLEAGRFGDFQSGMIPGRVTVRGRLQPPGTDAGRPMDEKESQLEFLTEQLHFDDQRIWTTQQVEFNWGSSFGTGRDLTITLADRDQTPRDPWGAPGMDAFDSLRLAKMDRLFLSIPATSAVPGAAGGRETIDVRAQGPLEVNLRRGWVQLSRQVELVREAPGQSDRVQCDDLLLLCDRPLPLPAATVGKSPRPSALTPARVVVRGTPATLESKRHDGVGDASEHRIQVQELDLDLREPPFASGGLAQVSPASAPSYLAGPAPFDELSPMDAGAARLTGPGVLQSAIHTARRHDLTVRFGRLATWTPQGDRAICRLEGDAEFELRNRGKLQAGALEIVLRRDSGDRLPRTAVAQGPNAQLRSWTPETIRSLGRVEVTSERLVAQTEQLEVEFVPEAPEPSEPNPDTLWIGDPNPRSGDRDSDSRPGRQLELVAGSALLSVALDSEDKPQLRAATLRGQVRCREIAPDATEPRFSAEGEQARLEDFGRESGRVAVLGRPAILRVATTEWTGSNVQLDIARNEAWIDGPGLVTMPLAPDWSRHVPPQLAQATLTWNRQMRFDGRRLRCEDGVSVRGPLQLVRGQALEVELSRPLRFASTDKSGREIAPKTTRVAGDVFIENRTIDLGGLVSIDSARVASLEMDHATGEFRGVGPGWVESIRRSDAGFGGGGPQAGTTDPTQLVFFHIDFQHQARGSLTARDVRFANHVQTTYGPVRAWTDRIAATRREELPPQAFLVDCEELRILQVPRVSAGTSPFELIAAGNTTIQGQQFLATADRLSYDQAKDLLVLEGNERTDARIRHQARDGATQSENAAKKLEFRPKSNQLKIQDLRFLELRTRSRRSPDQAP